MRTMTEFDNWFQGIYNTSNIKNLLYSSKYSNDELDDRDIRTGLAYFNKDNKPKLLMKYCYGIDLTSTNINKEKIRDIVDSVLLKFTNYIRNECEYPYFDDLKIFDYVDEKYDYKYCITDIRYDGELKYMFSKKSLNR